MLPADHRQESSGGRTAPSVNDLCYINGPSIGNETAFGQNSSLDAQCYYCPLALDHVRLLKTCEQERARIH